MSHNWLFLQRFAEGGDGGSATGGEGNAAGVTPDNPGRARLLELGVPEGKISKRAEKAVSKRMDAFKGNAEAQAAAVQNTTPTEEQQEAKPEAKPEESKRMTWKEITEDPEYSAELQKMIQGRLRKSKGAEETLNSLSGAMEVLARKYNMDPGKLDYAALGKAIEEDATLDQQFYEDLARKTGTSVDAARTMDRQAREQERAKRVQEMTAKEQAMAQHFATLEQQAIALKEKYPSFDLREAMKDDRFARAVSPGGGLSVEQAYTAFHYKEIQAAQNEIMAKKLREEMAKSLQSNRNRPQELGTGGAAPSVTSIDWRKATPEQLREMNERVRREGRVPL